MEVAFKRTGERRYTVTVFRDGLPPHEFGGPGYDAKMPHDLQHFIVERELGITHGIFGFSRSAANRAVTNASPAARHRGVVVRASAAINV